MAKETVKADNGKKATTAKKTDDKEPAEIVYHRPFPWNLAPDWFWFAQGSIQLILVFIPLMTVILSTNVQMVVCKKIYASTAGKKWTDWAVGHIRKIATFFASFMLKDIRDAPYLPWMFIHTVIICSLAPWVFRRYKQNGLELWVVYLYHFFRLGPRFRMFAHHHTLSHKEGHAHHGLFKGIFRIFNGWNQGFVGLFYGTVHRNYSVSHTKVHHRWHNDLDDVHTNIDLDRSKLTSLVLYLPRFLNSWTGVSSLILFLKRGEFQYAFDHAMGMLYYYSVLGCIGLFIGWDFMFAYFVIPFLESVTFLAVIAYLWHGFVEPEDPDNQYINSMTILNGKDNVFGEDYHVVHHHAPSVHWTLTEQHYKDNIEHYKANNATIFRDTEQGELIAWLFAHDWEKMADHWVDLSGKLTRDEIIAMLKRRVTYRKPMNTLGGWAGFKAWGNTTIRDWDNVDMETQKKAGAQKKNV